MYFYILPLGNRGNAFLKYFMTGILQYFLTRRIDLRQFLLQQSSSVSHSSSAFLHTLLELLTGFSVIVLAMLVLLTGLIVVV